MLDQSGILGYWLFFPEYWDIASLKLGYWDIGHEEFGILGHWFPKFLMANIPISQFPHGYPNIPVSERQYLNIPEKMTNIPISQIGLTPPYQTDIWKPNQFQQFYTFHLIMRIYDIHA